MSGPLDLLFGPGHRVIADGDCWLWTGSTTDKGYGQLRVGDRIEYVHRLVYRLFVGPLTKDITVDHLCNRPTCVNPAHLELVSRAENSSRAAARRTHCPNGHAYSVENTAYPPRGGRACLTCRRASWRRRAALDAYLTEQAS